MMKLFSEQASSYEEAKALGREKYGKRANITNHRRVVHTRGFLGIGRKDYYEVTGFVPLEDLSTVGSPLASKEFDATRQEIIRVGKKNSGGESGTKDSAAMDPAIAEILANFKDIKTDVKDIKKKIHQGEKTETIDAPTPIVEIHRLLKEKEFSQPYIHHILKQCRSL